MKITPRYGIVLLVLLGVASIASGSPGEIIETRFDRSYSRAQVDDLLPVLFEDVASPDASYGVDAFLVDFETTSLDGTRTPATMQLFVPQLSGPETVPVYLFAPGSTGLVNACRPSREHVIGVDWGRYRIHGLAHAARGTIVAIPDYMNFSVEDEIQPYFISEAEARVVLDAARAVRDFAATSAANAAPSDGVVLAGYSQGGHAVFAAADARATYAPDVEIAGIVGYGPSTNIENLFREWTVAAPLVTYAYATFYGEEQFDPSLILADRWLESLAHDATSQCIGAIQRYYPTEPGPLYRPAFADALENGSLDEEYPEISRLMEANNAGLSGHGIPVLILAGTDDIVVYPESQTEFVNALRERGSDVRYRVFDGVRHDTRQIGFEQAVSWTRDRALDR
ncbi:MAG: lipase family protein [Spirochaetota bacterium]